jgi:hypothetical protein
MAQETMQYPTKLQRDTEFDRLRFVGDANEKQVVKFSDVEQQPDGTWKDVWLLAYPSGQTQY